MGNEGSRGTTNGTAVVVQGPQQNGLNENDGNGTIHVDVVLETGLNKPELVPESSLQLGEQVVEELNRNEPTIDPQPVIDKADEQNTDINVNIQESGDQNDEKTVEITEKKKPKKRSFFSKEKVKLRDKKDKVKDIEKDIKIESIVEDNVKTEVVLPDVELVNGEHENQQDVTPPALPDKIGKENTEKPVTKKKDDKEEKKRLKEEKKRLKEEKEEKKRLKEEKKRSKSKKLKNESEQDKKVQVEEIPVSTENFLCICPGMEDIPQNSEHKETLNDETKDTTDLTNVVSENVEIVNEKVTETEKDVSSNVNKEIEKCTSAIPNGDNIISENVVGQIQDASEITNGKTLLEISKGSVGEHIKQNLDQSCPLPVIETDKSPNSDQMTSKDSLTNLLMVEEDVITLEDADVKTDADVIEEGASCEDIDANKATLPVVSQSVPQTVDDKITEETEVCITTDVESRDNADTGTQESVLKTLETPSDNLCSVTDTVRETVSECKEVDIIVKESEALVQSKVQPEPESIQSQVETEQESAKVENDQTNNDSNELVLSSVEKETNSDEVQLNENEAASKEVETKEACHQSEKDGEKATNETIESSVENKLIPEEEKSLKSVESTAKSKLLDETNNNCSPTELTTDESKNDSVDEKVVSENNKIQLEFKADSVKVNTVSENDELKENPEDARTTLDIKHDGQMESTTDDLKKNSVDEKLVLETVTESVAETIAQEPNPNPTDKTEEETLSLQSDFSVDTSPDSKNVTKDKKSKDKSKVKDKKKKDKSKGRSKVNSESSHDNVSVTSSSHSESPKSKNKKDKSKKKSSKRSDIHDNDSTTASECLSNTSDLDHSFSEIHKNDAGHFANDKKAVKETVSVDSHEKRKSGNIFSWNLLKSHKTEEEKDKKKKVKMRGVGKDMIQHPVNDTEETNKRRSIFDEEIHIELDDSHDIVSLSSLESDTNSECSSMSGTSNNKETQSMINFNELDELESDDQNTVTNSDQYAQNTVTNSDQYAQNTVTNSDQDPDSMTATHSGPMPDLLITKSDVGNSQEKVNPINVVAFRENKDEIKKVGQSHVSDSSETDSKSNTEHKEKSAIKISIKVESKYVDPVIYGTSSYNGEGVETQTRGTQTEYVTLIRKPRRALHRKEEKENDEINEINEHKDNEKEGEGHGFSSHFHGFTHKYTLPLVVKAGYRRKNAYGMKKGKNLMFRRHMSDESGYIATNSCNLTRPLSFQYKESETEHVPAEAGSIQLAKYKINQRQPASEKQDIPESTSPSTSTIDAEESKEEKKPKSESMFI